jgi:hypothetical protein
MMHGFQRLDSLSTGWDRLREREGLSAVNISPNLELRLFGRIRSKLAATATLTDSKFPRFQRL